MKSVTQQNTKQHPKTHNSETLLCVNHSGHLEIHWSVIEELFGVSVGSILCYVAPAPGVEVCPQQTVEVNQNHAVHHDHGNQEVAGVVEPGVVIHNVPGDVELGTKAKEDVGE